MTPRWRFTASLSKYPIYTKFQTPSFLCLLPQYITIFFHLTTYLQTIVREAKVCSSMFSFSLPYTTIYISVYSRENVKTSKSDDGPMQNLLKNISTDNLLSGSLMSKTQFLPPQKKMNRMIDWWTEGHIFGRLDRQKDRRPDRHSYLCRFCHPPYNRLYMHICKPPGC